jgi:D-alanine-D-alanine ligase
MTPLSLVPEQARHCSMSYEELVEAIIAAALRHHRKQNDGHS